MISISLLFASISTILSTIYHRSRPNECFLGTIEPVTTMDVSEWVGMDLQTIDEGAFKEDTE